MNILNEEVRCLRTSIATLNNQIKELKEKVEYLEKSQGELQQILIWKLDELDKIEDFNDIQKSEK